MVVLAFGGTGLSATIKVHKQKFCFKKRREMCYLASAVFVAAGLPSVAEM